MNHHTQIVDKVRKMDSIIGEITTAAREQSNGISQIDHAITRIESVTQSTAASAKEMAASVGTLKEQALITVDRFAENRKLLFLFRIMDTPGLFLIHEETLREINRSLVLLIHEQSFEEIEQFLLTTFQLLKANVRKFPHTSLQCIQVLGTEIFKKGSGSLVESFL